MTADAYGAGEADALLGRALAGVPRADYALVGAVGHDFYEGERDGAKGFPRFTDPRLRGPADYAGYLRMAAERSLERLGADALRRAAAAQPRPARLRVARGLGGPARAARRGADARAGRGARARQRLHARRDRLLRALRRADRLGDADPRPARALAGRAAARRRRAQRRAGRHPRGRLRRPASTTTCCPDTSSPAATTAASGPTAGSRRDARSSTGCARSRERHSLYAASAGLRLEPRAPGGRVRGADPDRGGAARQADRAQARGAGRRAGRARRWARRRSRRSARSATTAARCCSRARRPTTRARRPPTAGRSAPRRPRWPSAGASTPSGDPAQDRPR